MIWKAVFDKILNFLLLRCRDMKQDGQVFGPVLQNLSRTITIYSNIIYQLSTKIFT